ncbi:hypothetical protein STIUS_v1c03350 [Spiroplasma sp. TIUS-1]|uniref:hypothetical protein n=1 Tax=Spiroplasma sp. TIUS-1 TaxID=216963 RepID=UPI0013985ECE|nr:hypothetical protein [Spiroplasma sp. TIUS-1]QHX35889.1 hypothetical protein STIUS_v1c03350 [Spiroplasma sp. TIUS-1]
MRQEEKDELMKTLVIDAFVDLMLIGEPEVTEQTIDNFLKDRYFLDRYLKLKKSFEEEISKKSKLVEMPKVKLSENVYTTKSVSKNDINNILKNARLKNDNMKQNSWTDPQDIIEANIIKEAEKSGKSAYDSDVLRELILTRQKNKNKDSNINLAMANTARENAEKFKG